MSFEVRPIRAEELVGFVEAMSTGFLDRPNVQAIADEVANHWDVTRTWASFDGGRVVGTFRSWAGRLTVPGCREVPAAAISGVTVMPTHRRHGLLSRMAGSEHAAARERGELVSMLFASEFPIYGRFGYGPATMTAAWNVDVGATRLLADADGDVDPDAGRIELVRADDETLELARDAYDRWRIRQPGEIWRRPITWRDDFGLADDVWGNRWKGFLVLHRDGAGTVDGFARYHAEEKWVDRQPQNKLIIDDLHGVTDAAELALWRYLFAVDLVTSIRADRRSPAERLPWLLTNHRAAVPDTIGDGLWVKLLDVPAALEARTYERSGSVVLELVDVDGADANRDRIERRIRVALDATPDGAAATLTDRSPDLTVHAGALGAAYLGGTRLSRAALARGFDEHRPGAMAEAEALFVTAETPWCSSFF